MKITVVVAILTKISSGLLDKKAPIGNGNLKDPKTEPFNKILKKGILIMEHLISKCIQLRDGLIAQPVEHCTGMAEVMGSNPVQA